MQTYFNNIICNTTNKKLWTINTIFVGLLRYGNNVLNIFCVQWTKVIWQLFFFLCRKYTRWIQAGDIAKQICCLSHCNRIANSKVKSLFLKQAPHNAYNQRILTNHVQSSLSVFKRYAICMWAQHGNTLIYRLFMVSCYIRNLVFVPYFSYKCICNVSICRPA